jgi:3',5'-cyclic AMP phosphodiesterase CpdA
MRILLVTDSHLAARAPAFNANWAAAKAFAARARADLTIHLGDISLDAARKPAELAFAAAQCKDWPTALRFLPGNHDIGDNPPKPGEPAEEPLDLDLLKRYRQPFGADYWSIAAGRWSLLGLDAELLGSDTAEEAAQWAWLEATLAALKGRPVMLFLHKPLFLDDPAAATEPLYRYVPVAPRRRLLDLLTAIELPLVVSGHVHQYLDHVVAGTRHVWLPSTAFILPDDKQDRVGAKLTGMGVLELGDDGLRFDLVTPEGMARHDIVALGIKV